MNQIRTLLALASLLPVLAWGQPAGTAKPVKPVKVVPGTIVADDSGAGFIGLFGGSAVGNGLPDADPSTANTAQLTRSFLDVATLNVQPKWWFGLGGLVSNVPSDGGKALTDRLGLLQKFFATRAKAPVQLVIGSEAQGADGATDQAAYSAWIKANAPNATSANSTTTVGSDVFISLDTERPEGIDTAWLAGELKKADVNTAVAHVYVLGFRPMAVPGQGSLDSAGQQFVQDPHTVQAVETMAKSAKVVGYFCGSPGVFDVAPLAKGSSVPQVVVGHAGGPLDPTWVKSGGGHGFALIVLHTSGIVGIVPFFRPAPPVGQEPYATGPKPLSAAIGQGEILLWKPKRPGKT